MAVKNTVYPIPLISINSNTFTGSYQLLTPAGGLPAACFFIQFINSCDKNVTISFDGTNDHDFVVANTSSPRNFQANAQPTGSMALIPAGQQIWVKGSAGTGLFYLVGYYNPKGLA